MTTHPTIGVEEEFLLADPATGEPVAVNETVAGHAADRGVKLQLELTSCQVETTTDVVGGSRELGDQLSQAAPHIAAEAAEAGGAQLLAVGLPPTVPHEFPITDTPRYRQIADRFGMIAHEQGICGATYTSRCRPAKPRSRSATGCGHGCPSCSRSPRTRRSTATPTPATPAGAVCCGRGGPAPDRRRSSTPPTSTTPSSQMLHHAGAILDDGMVYWDVRPSANFPTIEVRVADVPATVSETVLLAVLIRAAVMTALDEERRGESVPPLTPHALRAAYWKSARDGLDGDALDLTEGHESRTGTNVVGPHGRARPARARGGRRLRPGDGRTGAASPSRATGRCGNGRRGSVDTTSPT